MMDGGSGPQLPPADTAWEEIEAAIDKIARLSAAELSARDFHAELLRGVVAALAAVGGVVWTIGAEGRLELDYQIQLDEALAEGGELARERHQRLLEAAARAGQPQLAPPHSGDEQLGNPTRCLLLLGPFIVDQVPVGVIEILQRPEASPELQRGYLQILTTVCELAGDFYRDQQRRDLQERLALASRVRDFTQAAHAALDITATAFAIANEGRQLIGCDRVSVLACRGGRFRLEAISGVDSFQRRSNLVRRLEALGKQVAVSGEVLWYPDAAAVRPPQIDAVLEPYLDESHARSLAVVPLRAMPRQSAEAAVVGALVIERFDATTDADWRARIAGATPAAAAALQNAIEYQGLPLLSLMRLVRHARWYTRWEQLPKTLTAVVVAAALLLALAVVPADFRITARGELQPQRRFHVFATGEGIITSLPKGQGDAVRRGETLAVLHSPKLELDFTEVVGRRRTTEEQLAVVRTARMRNDPALANVRDRYELTAQEEQLKERLAGLQKQFDILDRQRRQLEVRSPTDGQVLTWDIERLLTARPVQRGEKLLTVADLQGPWELALKIEDEQAGHVLAAQQTLGAELPVTFILATNPGVTYEGRLRVIASATEVQDDGRPLVSATVSITGQPPADLRPGATVIAKLSCGRRAVGYVWFHQLWEAIQSRLLF